MPRLPLLLVGGFLALMLVPRIGEQPALVRTFLGVAGALLAWSGVLWARDKGRAHAFGVTRPPVLRTHLVQAFVQVCIYAYWGWYWRPVYSQASLFVAQAIFLCTFDALLAWSRGRAWRFGMGPLPIILSTNIFLWFRDDHYVWQFALLAVAALGKEFITWNREGRRRHIFNPSALALAVFSLVLIATDSTDVTWAPDITTTIFRPPYIYLQIFLLGLLVQFLFGTVLMTLSAAAVLYLFNQIYTSSTGTYFFIDTNIPAAVFLGFHLLVTDPSTSPRSTLGKLLFGGMYGALIWVLYAVLGSAGAPQLYDKLLPIPLLNLSVRLLDRVTAAGIVGRLTRWEAALPRRRTNLVYMSGWMALFVTMYASGFVESRHEGGSIAFWRQAYVEGKPGADKRLLQLIATRVAKREPVALNAMGSLVMEGRLLAHDPPAAAAFFADACEGGNAHACGNVVELYLQADVAKSPEAVELALTHLEELVAGDEPTGEAAFLLGLAHETGKGRPRDASRFMEYYVRGSVLGDLDASKSVARTMNGQVPNDAIADGALDALRDVIASDAEACLILARALDRRPWLARETDPSGAALLEQACDLGHQAACEARVGLEAGALDRNRDRSPEQR